MKWNTVIRQCCWYFLTAVVTVCVSSQVWRRGAAWGEQGSPGKLHHVFLLRPDRPAGALCSGDARKMLNQNKNEIWKYKMSLNCCVSDPSVCAADPGRKRWSSEDQSHSQVSGPDRGSGGGHQPAGTDPFFWKRSGFILSTVKDQTRNFSQPLT